MTARPTDWSPLDCSRDPVSGEPDAVRAAARQSSRRRLVRAGS